MTEAVTSLQDLLVQADAASAKANYLFHPISTWKDADDDARVIALNRAFAEAMRPYGTGGGDLNFTPERNRVREAFGEAKYERLVALKDSYDPENLFRMNHNIEPSLSERRVQAVSG
jgi:FAD/FMN-containing dehydrogenase